MTDIDTSRIARIHSETSRDRLLENLAELPGPRSRLHHPQAMAAADALLVKAWTEVGWEVSAYPYHLERAEGIEDFGSFAPTVHEDLNGINMVAVKRGPCDGAVVIGAHHDTVRDSPGACDNGAGVAALIEIARLLAPLQLRKSVILAAFDMEEIGVLGSPPIVEALAQQYQIDCAIVLESIGYVDPAPGSQRIPFGFGLFFPRQTGIVRLRRRRADWTAAIYRGSAVCHLKVLARELRVAAGPNSVIALRDPLDRPVVGPLLKRLVPSLKNLARSDHTAFWERDIPAILLTDTANFRSAHYHRESDTVETLNFDHLRAITAAVAATAARLACDAPS